MTLDKIYISLWIIMLLQQLFYLSFMLGQMDFSDTAILGNILIDQIIVVNKILSVLMSLYFP